MAFEVGEIKLNGKSYKIDITSWREKDLTDFSPRAQTPGASIVKSELMLYQPIWQYDWRHGFGWQWHEDSSGYMRTEGNVDTRHTDIVMMMSKSSLSDPSDNTKDGMVEFNGSMYSYGSGIKKYGRIARLVAPAKPTVSVVQSTYTFQEVDSGNIKDTYISAATTTNYDTSNKLAVGHHGSTKRTLLNWDFSSIPYADVSFVSAALTFTVQENNATNNPTFQVYKLAREFDETTATYVKAKTGTNWSTAGCGNTTTDYDGSTLLGSTVISSPKVAGDKVTITLDESVLQTIISAGTYGFVLKTSAENEDEYDFYSSRATTADNRPKLEIVVSSNGNVNVGYHTYKVTLYDAEGETDGGTISNQVNITTTGQVKLTQIPVGGTGTVGRKIYRTKATAVDQWYLLATLSNNTTVEYLDNTADASLGAVIPVTNGTMAEYESWSSIYDSPVNFLLPTKNYLLIAPDGARLKKMTIAGDITDTGVNAYAVDFKQLVIYEGYIFGFIDDTNQVHYTSTEDLSLMEGETTDTNIVYCGPTGIKILKLITYAGKLYAMTQHGVWVLSDDKKIFRMVLDYVTEQSSNNFKSSIVFNGMMYYSIRDRLYSWNGARYNEITPRKLTDTFPYVVYGNFNNFVESDGFLYCTARTNETVYSEVLLCYDGAAWHKLMDVIDDGVGSVSMLAIDTLNSKLWYHIEMPNSNQTFYVNMPEIGDYPTGDFPTTGNHYLFTSRIDAGFREVTKSSPSIEIQASNVTASRYISVAYSIDGGAWVTWGSITSNGVTKLTTPGGNNTIEYKYIQFRFQFVTDDATESPIFEGMVLRILLRPNEFYGWNFNVVVATTMDSLGGEDSRSSYEIEADLKTARTSKAPIVFVDLFGVSRYGYISSLTFLGVEYHNEEFTPYPNVELVANVNFVEVL